MNWLRTIFIGGVLTGLCLPAAMAAPKLRLSNAALGPITIALGQNGPVQTLDAANFGDGSLALTVASSVTWIAPNIGPAHACALKPTCLAVNMVLNTATLTRGKYTGIVTVSDPNAVDAPQTISVTVQIGSAVPDSLTFFVPPGGSTKTSFTTGSNLFTTVNNPPGGNTLSVAATGGGSFSFQYSFQVTAQAPAGIADGSYQGNIVVAGSTSAADNKTVPVTMRVTSQPIADFTPDVVRFKIAQGATKVDKWVQFSNRGRGTLTLASATTNVPWLTAAVQGTIVVLTADIASMTVGTSPATLTVASNASNGPFTIPVQLDVVAATAPRSFYHGVVDNALFAEGDPVAPGGILAIKGDQFTTGAAGQAQTLPLGTALGGATVFVNNQPVPIYYVAGSHVVNDGGQINFQLPYSTPAGEALVRVDRDGQRGNTISVTVAPSVPRLMRIGIGDYAIAVNQDSSFPMPPTPGIPSHPAKAGDVLVFYALGLGQTNPPVTEGQAVVGLHTVSGYRLRLGAGIVPGAGFPVDPSYVGLTPGLVGLYQINVTIPVGAPTGDAVPVGMDSDTTLSNRVAIAIQ